MNKVDKAKLKVLIKMILINKSPDSLTSNQLAVIINKYDWGFKTDITSSKIGKLLGYELKKHDNHFLNCIEVKQGRKYSKYKYVK